MNITANPVPFDPENTEALTEILKATGRDPTPLRDPTELADMLCLMKDLVRDGATREFPLRGPRPRVVIRCEPGGRFSVRRESPGETSRDFVPVDLPVLDEFDWDDPEQVRLLLDALTGG